MPRTTRSQSVNGISNDERASIVHEVVQAVLEATSTNFAERPALSSSSSDEAGTQEAGTCNIPVPSFVPTFSMPASATNVIASAVLPPVATSSTNATTTALANTASLPTTSTFSAPILNQPFVVGPGYSPVPAKLVSQIVSGKYIDLSDLMDPNLMESENEPQVMFDGRIVLTSTPKRNRHKVEDIVTWIETFTTYMLVLTSLFPHRFNDLSRYLKLIVRTHQQLGGNAWLRFDKAFREHAAVTKRVDWSMIDTQLYSLYTAGAPARHHATLNDLQPTGSTTSDIICRSWNRGQCSSKYARCRFAHICSSCAGNHRSMECQKTSLDGDRFQAKRGAPSATEVNEDRAKAKRR